MTYTLLTSLKNLLAPLRAPRAGTASDAAFQQALTGYVQAQAVLAVQIVPEADVCDVSLMKLLAQAHLNPDLSVDGRIKVRTESGCTMSIHIDMADRSLQFVAIYRLAPAANATLRMALAQRINDTFRYARASLDSDGDLYLDYWYPYATGLQEGQFLHVLRRFGIVCTLAVHTADVSNIVL